MCVPYSLFSPCFMSISTIDRSQCDAISLYGGICIADAFIAHLTLNYFLALCARFGIAAKTTTLVSFKRIEREYEYVQRTCTISKGNCFICERFRFRCGSESKSHVRARKSIFGRCGFYFVILQKAMHTISIYVFNFVSLLARH